MGAGPIIFWTVVSAALLGPLLIILGRRGVRLNSHPCCQDCGFDVSASFPRSHTCPECGAGLNRARGIRLGQRKPLWLLIAPGIALASLAFLSFASVLLAALSGTDLNAHKPDAMLVWELQGARGTVADNAARLLTDRMLRRAANADTPRAAVDLVGADLSVVARFAPSGDSAMSRLVVEAVH